MKKRPQARFRTHVAKALRFFARTDSIAFFVSASELPAAVTWEPERAMRIQQVAAWNRGDIKGFMSGNWNSSELIYVGNTKVTRGRQTLLDRYGLR